MKFNTNRIIRDHSDPEEPWVYVDGQWFVEVCDAFLSSFEPDEKWDFNTFLPFEFYYGDHVKVGGEGS